MVLRLRKAVLLLDHGWTSARAVAVTALRYTKPAETSSTPVLVANDGPHHVHDHLALTQAVPKCAFLTASAHVVCLALGAGRVLWCA
jgi:hypothetical protein